MSMRKTANVTTIISGILLLAACSREPALPDLSGIPWVTEFAYNSDHVFALLSSGSSPGPRVKVTVNGDSEFLLIDLNSIDLFLNDNCFRNIHFEPQRMSNHITATSEILVEEGFLHDVSFLGNRYPVLYVSVIKRSSPPYRIPGIIGRNFLIDGQLTFDMPNKVLAFSTDPTISPGDLTADSNLVDISLKLKNNDDLGMFKFPCRVNGTPCLATLSTNSKKTQISQQLAQMISPKADIKNTTIESLQVGSKIFHGINCDINAELITLEPENADPIDILIGIDLLKRAVWTIDFISRQMFIQ
jgi:hypothetical protein